MSEFRKVLSNDLAGHREAYVYAQGFKAGAIAADALDQEIFVAPFAGKITNVWGRVGTNGVDASNPLDLKFTVKKNGTAVCSTDPDIAKAAGTGAKSTFAAGTGITQAVIKSDGTQIFAKGDRLAVDWDITRTNTPSTEIADATVIIEVLPYVV